MVLYTCFTIILYFLHYLNVCEEYSRGKAVLFVPGIILLLFFERGH